MLRQSSVSCSTARGAWRRSLLNNNAPTAEYEAELRDILTRRDWEGLREFTRRQNQVPDDVYEKDQHFWEVLLHKLTCNRIDTLGLHDESRGWLEKHGYTTDIGGY